ncbi:hypothetical protein ARMSODRAFT_34345 [Armillaria solidipes]|uniref:Secreted protein n=1 Tax=Armillaria solidipes TaxID=1076256 RepID=A0A2H3CAE7_9AGAR|nr:hypothetical protein ARMSODRAFT_34345 [Armillaria solidipes]
MILFLGCRASSIILVPCLTCLGKVDPPSMQCLIVVTSPWTRDIYLSRNSPGSAKYAKIRIGTYRCDHFLPGCADAHAETQVSPRYDSHLFAHVVLL